MSVKGHWRGIKVINLRYNLNLGGGEGGGISEQVKKIKSFTLIPEGYEKPLVPQREIYPEWR